MRKKSVNKPLMDTIKDHYENPSQSIKDEYQRMTIQVQKEINNLASLTKTVMLDRVKTLLENNHLLIVGLSGLNIQIEHECFWNEDNKDFNPVILKNQYNDLILAWSCKKTEKLYRFLVKKEVVSDLVDYEELKGIVTVATNHDKLMVFQENLKQSVIEANVSAIQNGSLPYKYLYIHSIIIMNEVLEYLYLKDMQMS